MKKHSLTRQITSIVSILVAGAILLCWVLNTTLLPRYYMHNKKHVLMENYETISNASEQDKLESDEFTVTFDNLCSNGNIMTLILQPDGKVLRSSVNDLDALRGELWNVLLHTDDMEVLYSNDQYQLLRKNDTRLDSEYLVLVGVLENGDMILMRTAVESIRESAVAYNKTITPGAVCRSGSYRVESAGGIFYYKTYYKTVAAADGYFQTNGRFGL